MLAYYALFSFVPVIYIVLAVAGIFIDELRAASQLYVWVGETLGPESSQLLQDQMNRVAARSTGEMTVETVIGFAVLLGTASLLFYQLQHALNTIWKVPPPQRGATRFLILNRLLAFIMVIGLGLLLVVVTFGNTLVTGLRSWIGLSSTLPFASLLSSILLLTFMLAVLYKFLPNAKVAWRDVLVGSLVAAVLLTLAGSLLGLYLSASRLNSASGAAGAVAMFLTTFYFIGLIIVVGAVVIRVYASVHGRKIVPRVEPPPEQSPEKLPAEGDEDGLENDVA
jgi:membrane protein